MAYSYTGLYLLATKKISRKQFTKVKYAFVFVSLLFFGAVIAIGVVQMNGGIPCGKGKIGNLVLAIIELPVYIIGTWFAYKTKKDIKRLQVN